MKYLVPLYLKFPSTEVEWLLIAKKFGIRWQYPNAIGSVDGKHVVIWKPSDGGLHYYNYKHSHSIILMAIADPSYECLYANLRASDRVNDGGVWNKCSFSKALEKKELSIPNPRCLPGEVQKIPIVLIGDDALAVKTHMMKHYPQQILTTEKRVYNYRHIRGIRISENLFCILANRWRIYHTVMLLEPKTVASVILSTLALHNMLMKSSAKNIYWPTGLCHIEGVNQELTLGIWRNDNCADSMYSLEKPIRGHNAAKKFEIPTLSTFWMRGQFSGNGTSVEWRGL